MEASLNDRYQVQALAKGLRVLECFSAPNRSLRMSDIAEATGMPLSTVFRFTRTLVEAGYLEERLDGTFRLTAAVLRMGLSALSSLEVVEAGKGPLRELSQTTKETVNLAILNGQHITYLIRFKNQDLVTADIRIGSELPVEATSMGKVMLAFTPKAERERIVSRLEFSEATGPNSPRSPELLRVRLSEIRQKGWGSQDEELTYGLRSIAAPVLDHSGEVAAAINLAVATFRYSMAELTDRFLPSVLETARRISTNLGYESSDKYATESTS